MRPPRHTDLAWHPVYCGIVASTRLATNPACPRTQRTATLAHLHLSESHRSQADDGDLQPTVTQIAVRQHDLGHLSQGPTHPEFYL